MDFKAQKFCRNNPILLHCYITRHTTTHVMSCHNARHVMPRRPQQRTSRHNARHVMPKRTSRHATTAVTSRHNGRHVLPRQSPRNLSCHATTHVTSCHDCRHVVPQHMSRHNITLVTSCHNSFSSRHDTTYLFAAVTQIQKKTLRHDETPNNS